MSIALNSGVWRLFLDLVLHPKHLPPLLTGFWRIKTIKIIIIWGRRITDLMSYSLKTCLNPPDFNPIHWRSHWGGVRRIGQVVRHYFQGPYIVMFNVFTIQSLQTPLSIGVAASSAHQANRPLHTLLQASRLVASLYCCTSWLGLWHTTLNGFAALPDCCATFRSI